MPDARSDTTEAPPFLAVSNAVVKFYKDTFGRGPTKARTHFAGRDILICTLRNCLTPPEQHLVRAGQEHRVRELRLALRGASSDQLETIIEQITGRKVWASVSGLDVTQEVSAEVFYLAPERNDDRASQ